MSARATSDGVMVPRNKRNPLIGVSPEGCEAVPSEMAAAAAKKLRLTK
ncbi:MAG: hypothetical protein ABI900_06930 [Betaproteobacteria bacterium]